MISQQFIQNGILQIGLFAEGDGHKPYRLRLEMLPAYPQLLEETSRRVSREFPGSHFDRIVADHDVMALGVLLSIGTGIPLVYSQGRGESPVHDLVGAYDVGHPAVLLVGEYSADTANLVQNCQRVGLAIIEVIALIGDEDTIGDIPVRPLLDFTELLGELTEAGLLPKRQAEAIVAYRR